MAGRLLCLLLLAVFVGATVMALHAPADPERSGKYMLAAGLAGIYALAVTIKWVCSYRRR